MEIKNDESLGEQEELASVLKSPFKRRLRDA